MNTTTKGAALLSDTPDGATVMRHKNRVNNVDILRGIVMIIMALDHVRDFWSMTPFRPEDVTQTSAGLFFTRWITHFCAPIFVFLSGISVYLYSTNKPLGQVRKYLLSRGLLLVVLEVLVVSFLLQFSYQFILIQIIWVIGWSMVLLSALVAVPRKYLLVISCIIIAGHNLLPGIQAVTLSNILPAVLLNSPFVVQAGNLPIIVAYTIFPWAAVMTAGFAVGSWFVRPAEEQNPLLLRAGFVLLALFAFLRAINIYGDPAPWQVQERGFLYSALSFINVSKYPPSLLFLCLTIGVALIMLAVFNCYRQRDGLLQVYGRVPFFYYLLHLAIIVAGAYIWSYLQFDTMVNFAFMPQAQWPAGYEPSLLRTYVVWIAVVALLYFPCRWYARYKGRSTSKWLSYL